LKRICSCCRAATLLAAFSVSVAQADFKAGVAASSQYDSNVLPDPELVDGRVSAAWGQKYSAYMALSADIDKRWQLVGRYDLSRSVWNDVSGYDSRIQSGYLRLSRRGIWSPEVVLLGADAHVEGRDFMQLRRISPALGYLLSKRWYLRTQLDLSDKHFQDYAERDSRQLHGRLLAFWLLDGTRRYLSVQGGLKQENADDDLYSYQAWVGRIKWKQRLVVMDSWFSVKAERRMYDTVRLSLGEERQDMRWRLASGLSWPLGAGIEMTGEVGRDMYHSNLDVADYAQNRLEVGIRWDY